VANCLQPEKIGENPAGKPKLVAFAQHFSVFSARGAGPARHFCKTISPGRFAGENPFCAG
jgi:hypothetical protein